MKNIDIAEIGEYIGATVGKEVLLKGFTIIRAGTILTGEMVEKLKALGDDISSITINTKVTSSSKSTEILISQLYPKVQKIMENYSFEDAEDVNAVSEIMESIIIGLSYDESLQELDLDRLLLSKPDLCAHSLNCAVIAALLSIKSARLQHWMVEQITLGALLHDVGMAELMDEYGMDWNDLPFEIKMRHPEVGFNLLKDNIYIADAVKKIVLMHHVWSRPEDSYDTTINSYRSYPFEYEGRKILPESKSLSVSIVQTADAFERLTNITGDKRLSKKDAIDLILKNSEKIYGEGAVLLSSYISPYSIGDIVELTNGKKAKVVKHTSSTLRPIVQYLGSLETVDLRRKPLIKIKKLIERR